MKNVILHPGKTCVDSFGYNSDSFPLDFKCIYKKKAKKRCGNAHQPTFGISAEQKQDQVPVGVVTQLKCFQFPLLQLKWKIKRERLIGQH